MRHDTGRHSAIKTRSEGSSLAIALFFFLACSLICASILLLSGSSLRGVSKSTELIPESFPSNPDDIPTPPPTEPTVIPAEYEDDVTAIDTIYATLCSDYYNAFTTAENGSTAEILKNPDNPKVNPSKPVNPSYEILSYIHSNYSSLKITVGNDEMINETFTYTVSGVVVYAEVEMASTKGSENNNGLQFNYFKLTVKSSDPECPYDQVYEYSAVENKKVYVKFNGANSTKRFEFTEK